MTRVKIIPTTCRVHSMCHKVLAIHRYIRQTLPTLKKARCDHRDEGIGASPSARLQGLEE
jgi:hypothetical protein